MSKGVSLHIGIDKLSLNAYEKEGLLNSPTNDARIMASIAKQEGFTDIKLLLNEQATKKNFLEFFDTTIKILEAGDLFLLTFSGHGGQLEDYDGDEEDGKDETWCLYDGCLVDDELGVRWKEFKSGVRIVVVSASCHSRTAIRVYTSDSFPGNPDPLNKKEIKQNAKSILSSYIKDDTIHASILHISACEDAQEALDGDKLSLFTRLLLKHWDNGHFTGNYEDLVRKIRAESGYNQRAGIATLGNNDPVLLNSQPFKLLTK